MGFILPKTFLFIRVFVSWENAPINIHLIVCTISFIPIKFKNELGFGTADITVLYSKPFGLIFVVPVPLEAFGFCDFPSLEKTVRAGTRADILVRIICEIITEWVCGSEFSLVFEISFSYFAIKYFPLLSVVSNIVPVNG